MTSIDAPAWEESPRETHGLWSTCVLTYLRPKDLMNPCAADPIQRVLS